MHILETIKQRRNLVAVLITLFLLINSGSCDPRRGRGRGKKDSQENEGDSRDGKGEFFPLNVMTWLTKFVASFLSVFSLFNIVNFKNSPCTSTETSSR